MMLKITSAPTKRAIPRTTSRIVVNFGAPSAGDGGDPGGEGLTGEDEVVRADRGGDASDQRLLRHAGCRRRQDHAVRRRGPEQLLRRRHGEADQGRSQHVG